MLKLTYNLYGLDQRFRKDVTLVYFLIIVWGINLIIVWVQIYIAIALLRNKFLTIVSPILKT